MNGSNGKVVNDDKNNGDNQNNNNNHHDKVENVDKKDVVTDDSEEEQVVRDMNNNNVDSEDDDKAPDGAGALPEEDVEMAEASCGRILANQVAGAIEVENDPSSAWFRLWLPIGTDFAIGIGAQEWDDGLDLEELNQFTDDF